MRTGARRGGRDLSGEVRFTPAMYLGHCLRERAAGGLGAGLETFGVAPLVVGSWFGPVTGRLAKLTGAVGVEDWPYGSPTAPHLYTATVSDGQAGSQSDGQGDDGADRGVVRVSFATLPVGAPATVAVMEELIACGARRFVGFGLAGSLQEMAPVGTVLVPGRCRREEGTSRHYLPPRAVVGPDPDLEAALVAALAAEGLAPVRGPHWTTDAPYREFIWKVERYRGEGVLGVDMETSAMYALGRFRDVAVANVLVVSDELWHEWRPAFGTEELGRALRRVESALVAHLPELARPGRATR